MIKCVIVINGAVAELIYVDSWDEAISVDNAATTVARHAPRLVVRVWAGEEHDLSDFVEIDVGDDAKRMVDIESAAVLDDVRARIEW